MVIHRRANLRCQSRAGVSVIPDSREVGYKSYDMLDGAALGISDLRSRSRIVSRGASASYDQIEHIDQIQEKELISGNILSELSAIGHDAVNGVSNDTAASEMVSLNGTVGIVGNMQNACGNAPSTVDKDGEVDIRMWVRAEELKPTTVHCDLPCSEVFQMSGAATTANSNDNVPADALAKAFNYDRKDIEDLSLSERHVLKEALGRLETMQSRKARFVRGWLYYFSLQGLPNSEYAGVIRMNRATIIQQDALAVVNQAARNNTAYAYCNMAHDQAYITFLYIISRKFGIAPGMLRRDSKDGGNEYFRARLLDIPDEADAFCVVCNTTPTNQMIGNAPIDIDSKIWHSYMVNYASSINANEMLSETKAIAMAAIYAEYLPSMHLEKQVSVSELCQTCAVTETFSTAVPLEGLVAKQVIGSVTCCLAILIKYRDLISNESVRVIKDGVPESYSNNMLGRPETRARIYSMIEREGLVGGAKIMAVMDVLNVIQNRSMNARKERLCNIPMVNLWATQPSSLVDFKSVIKNSISSTLVDFQWLSRARRREIRNTKTRVNGAINAVLAQMDIYTNVEKAKGVVFPRQSNINVDIAELDYVDKCLMEGKTTFVRVSRKITTRPTGSQSAWEGTRGSACKIGRLSRVKITLENDMSVDDEIMPGPTKNRQKYRKKNKSMQNSKTDSESKLLGKNYKHV